jgi:hypothetical protein
VPEKWPDQVEGGEPIGCEMGCEGPLAAGEGVDAGVEVPDMVIEAFGNGSWVLEFGNDVARTRATEIL